MNASKWAGKVLRPVAISLVATLLVGAVALPAAHAQTPPPPPPESPAAPTTPAPAPPVVPTEPPLFGTELFQQGVPTAAEALERAINSKTYRLGQGDRLLVSIWRGGKPANQFDMLVPLDGKVFFPSVGEVRVLGLTVDQFRNTVQNQLVRRLPGFQVSVLLTGLRSFKILVLGEVTHPGYVVANAVTRLSEVITVAQLDPVGTMRSIQVKSAAGKVRMVDLYDFLARARVSENPTVLDGDTILVPRRYGAVVVRGAVVRPGRYEIKKGDAIKDLFSFAGGLDSTAYRPEFHLIRVSDKPGQPPQQFIKLSLDAVLRNDRTQNLVLQDQDSLQIFSVLDFTKGDVVEVTGAVRSPGKFPLAAGMRVRDLLIAAGGPLADAFTERAELSRVRPQGEGVENRDIMQINIDQVLKDPGVPANVMLQPGDILTVYSVSFFRGGKVQITGAVRQPGEYELVTGLRLKDLLFRTGGLLPDANLQNAQLERIVNGKKTVFPLNLDKLILESDESANIQLQFGDVILIPSILILAPIVFVEGRVKTAGGFPYRENESVVTLLVRAGGPIFESEPLTNEGIAGAGGADLKAVYIDRPGPSGTRTRLPVDLYAIIVYKDLSKDVKLLPGDVLVIPSTLNVIYVQGFVSKQGTFPYEPNRTVRHYVGLAAPLPPADLNKVVVRRLNGTLTGGLDTIVERGDTILVPQNTLANLLSLLGLLSPLWPFIR